MSELRAVLEMTTARPDKLKDGDATDIAAAMMARSIQLGPLSSDSDAMFEVVEISDACFLHLLLQYAPHAVVNQI